jgi:hypothetical protein
LPNNIVANSSQTGSPVQPNAQPLPASSPGLASASQSAPAGGNQPLAQTSPGPNQATSPPPQSAPAIGQQTKLPAPNASTSTDRAVVAAGTPAQPPAVPAEGPETVWQRESDAKQKAMAQNSTDEADSRSASDTKQPAKKTAKQSSGASSRSRSKTSELASNGRRAAPRYDRSRISQIPSNEEDQYQRPYQPYQQDQAPRPRRALPVPEGSFRAKVVGITPGGNLILRLPSGEIAIVPNRHRPRRIWVERPPFVEPPPRPEFGPMIPPDA